MPTQSIFERIDEKMKKNAHWIENTNDYSNIEYYKNDSKFIDFEWESAEEILNFLEKIIKDERMAKISK